MANDLRCFLITFPETIQYYLFMRNLKPILAALLLCVSLPMSAQFMNMSSPTNDRQKSYTRIHVGYVNTQTSGDGGKDFDGDNVSLNGVFSQVSWGIPLSTTSPVYLDLGVRLAYATCEEEGTIQYSVTNYYNYDNGYYNEYRPYTSYSTSDITLDVYKLSFTMPISLGYRARLGEDSSFMPYAGLHFSWHLYGQEDVSVGSETESINPFDEDEAGKDGKWTRFQSGWQIGAVLTLNRFTIGLEYSYDFNELAKDCKTSDLLLSLGVTF